MDPSVIKRVQYGFAKVINLAARALLETPGMAYSMNRESKSGPKVTAQDLIIFIKEQTTNADATAR